MLSAVGLPSSSAMSGWSSGAAVRCGGPEARSSPAGGDPGGLSLAAVGRPGGRADWAGQRMREVRARLQQQANGSPPAPIGCSPAQLSAVARLKLDSYVVAASLRPI